MDTEAQVPALSREGSGFPFRISLNRHPTLIHFMYSYLENLDKISFKKKHRSSSTSKTKQWFETSGLCHTATMKALRGGDVFGRHAGLRNTERGRGLPWACVEKQRETGLKYKVPESSNGSEVRQSKEPFH